MAKGKKNKAATTAMKKAGAKTMGEDVIEVDTPQSKKAKRAPPHGRLRTSPRQPSRATP